MCKYIMLLFIAVFLQCAGTLTDVWSLYSIKYIGSEQELDAFVKNLVEDGCEYKIYTHDEGVFEVHYKIRELK